MSSKLLELTKLLLSRTKWYNKEIVVTKQERDLFFRLLANEPSLRPIDLAEEDK